MKDYFKILLEDVNIKSFVMFAAVLIFMPGIILVFVWDRTMFYELDIIKLTCLIVSIGMTVTCINNAFRLTALSIYHDIKRNKNSDDKIKEDIKVVVLKELSMSMYMTAIEFLGLAIFKRYFPNLTINYTLNLFTDIAIIGIIMEGILMIVVHVTNKFKFRKKNAKRKK